MTRFTLLPVLLTVLVLGFTACDDDSPTSGSGTSGSGTAAVTDDASLTAALQDILEDSGWPGLSVSIAVDNQIRYQSGFGLSDIESGKAYTPQTIQPIASISKTFIAAALMKAVEQGHLTMETPVNHVLPIELRNPLRPEAEIRIKHLVTHTSGIRDDLQAFFATYHILPGQAMRDGNYERGTNFLQSSFGAEVRAAGDLDEVLAEYFLPGGDLYSQANFAADAPGAVWTYSNMASSLVAFIIEESTQTDFREYVKTWVLQPLGMHDSGFDVNTLDQANLATLYYDRASPLPQYGFDAYPSGGIYASSQDMSLYMLDMLLGAQGLSSVLFSAEHYAQLFKSPLSAAGAPQNNAIFWFLENGKPWHSGGDPGLATNLVLDPERRAAWYIAINNDALTEEHNAVFARMNQRIDAAVRAYIQAN